MLEVIGHQHGRAVSLLDNAFQRVQLGIMDVLPLPFLAYVHRAVGDLQQLLRPHGGVGRLDLVLRELREHLRLHRHVQLAHRRDEVGVDRHHVRLLDGQRTDRQAYVAQLLLDLTLRVLVRHEAVAVVALAEPPLLEGAERAAQTLALVDEPYLPPQILYTVGRRRPCEADKAAPLSVDHLTQQSCPRASLTQPVRLQAGELVRDHRLERPRIAQLPAEPADVVVIHSVNVGVLSHRTLALLLRAGDDADGQVRQVVPLLDLFGPR